ncbi:MAG: DUF3800 domain-containing protein [Anaerolineae bacterium]|nr:DUF3800 domain-containing protein [Anaerolineae bacterium]
MSKTSVSARSYFVDEAGDAVLFSSKRRGKVIVGTSGCSRYFILGMVDIPDVATVGRELNILRAELLADPYFKGVPSMQPDAHKTADAFHAKDDIPEVRRAVFDLLRRHEFHFSAVVRDKLSVVRYVRDRNRQDSVYRYHPNELYDYLVRRLFKNRLHKDDEYHIYFARRGKADRTAALQAALETARQQFSHQYNLTNHATINVIPTTPAACPGQQVTDYFLWALQRFYESGEGRYIELLWDSVSVIHDMDDTRKAGYGIYYTRKKPLSPAALQDRPGI